MPADPSSQVKADAEATELQGNGRACAEREKRLYPSHHCRSPLSPLDLPPHELLPELPRRSEKIVPSAKHPKVLLAARPSLSDWIDVVDLEPSPGRAPHTAGSPVLTLVVRTRQTTLAH